jgi:hypothetical protein
MLPAKPMAIVRQWIDDPNFKLQYNVLQRCMLAMAPAFLSSLLFGPRFTAIVVLLSSWTVVYQLTAGFQAELFTLPLRATHLTVAIPVIFLFYLWCFLVLLFGRAEYLAIAVAPMVVLILTAIAPLYRKLKSERTSRRLPYRWTYGIAAAVVFMIEGIVLWELS